jgi:hypothetical protein
MAEPAPIPDSRASELDRGKPPNEQGVGHRVASSTVTPREVSGHAESAPPKTAGDELPVDEKQLIRGVSSLTAFIEAYKNRRADPGTWTTVLKEFEDENGPISDSYITSKLDSGAILLKRGHASRLPWRGRRRHLLVRLDRSDNSPYEPQFDQVMWRALWTARRTERESDYLLPRRSRKVFADMLYSVVVYLLGTLDMVARRNAKSSNAVKVLQKAASSAKQELDELERYAERAAIRTAIRYYLLGLPLGALFLSIVVLFVQSLDLTGQSARSYAVIAVVAGGIGSMASVMFRITRGQRLSVDIQQGPWVTVFAGMFRPLIGAVFGVALYVLVQGDLLPLDVPEEYPDHFYAGLAFIAGFSERWAQDTIVRSAPIAPSPATPTGRSISDRDSAPEEDYAQADNGNREDGN